MLYILRQVDPVILKEAGNQFEKIGNPILALLLVVLTALIVYFVRENKIKDKFIHKLYLEQKDVNIKNIEVLTTLKTSMDLDTASGKLIVESIKDVITRINENSLILNKIESLFLNKN